MLALSALVITAGCKKNISSSSVDLSKGAKAGFTPNSEWQNPSKYGRVIHFDIGDGRGASCLLTYDVNNNHVSLTQIIGNTSNNLWTSYSGFLCDNHATINVTDYNGNNIADNFNEVGGTHVIAYDANGTGHDDHVLIYVPGQGILYLLRYQGGIYWHLEWSSTTGIAGYDLKGAYDKIISYDYGSGTKNALITYRPGSGFVWVININGSGDSRYFTAAVRGNSGIGGFDLKGQTDQIVAVDHNAGAMDLVCYRPAYGYVWYLNHSAYSTNFTAANSTHSGMSGFSFLFQQDRLFAINTSGSSVVNANNLMFMYRPGYGMGNSAIGGSSFVTTPALTNYPELGGYSMSASPYNPYTYIGDHVVTFNGNGYGNSSLLFYTNGSYASQVYEYNPNTQHFSLTQ